MVCVPLPRFMSDNEAEPELRGTAPEPSGVPFVSSKSSEPVGVGGAPPRKGVTSPVKVTVCVSVMLPLGLIEIEVDEPEPFSSTLVLGTGPPLSVAPNGG